MGKRGGREGEKVRKMRSAKEGKGDGHHSGGWSLALLCSTGGCCLLGSAGCCPRLPAHVQQSKPIPIATEEQSSNERQKKGNGNNESDHLPLLISVEETGSSGIEISAGGWPMKDCIRIRGKELTEP